VQSMIAQHLGQTRDGVEQSRYAYLCGRVAHVVRSLLRHTGNRAARAEHHDFFQVLIRCHLQTFEN
jgi:hypothetical protein